MSKWVALLDENGKEPTYYGYARQKAPPESLDWELVVFGLNTGPAFYLCAISVCDSEASPIENWAAINPCPLIAEGATPQVMLRDGYLNV